jgi:uncharacterized protein (AIM24 family)
VIHGELLQINRPNPSRDRMVAQNSKMLKVTMGPDLLARKGAMVAYDGFIDFDHQGAGLERFVKKWLTGEGVPLMRCTGQGDLYLGANGADIISFYLENDEITVNSPNVVGFDATLSWDIKTVGSAAGMLAGGVFSVAISGSGWVALSSVGPPIVLRTDEAPTFVDKDAIVAWSRGLNVSLHRSAGLKALIGRGSGEAFQLAFQGSGYAVVQPSEPVLPKKA